MFLLLYILKSKSTVIISKVKQSLHFCIHYHNFINSKETSKVQNIVEITSKLEDTTIIIKVWCLVNIYKVW
jgi:hypothetical protein